MDGAGNWRTNDIAVSISAGVILRESCGGVARHAIEEGPQRQGEREQPPPVEATQQLERGRQVGRQCAREVRRVREELPQLPQQEKQEGVFGSHRTCFQRVWIIFAHPLVSSAVAHFQPFWAKFIATREDQGSREPVA